MNKYNEIALPPLLQVEDSKRQRLEADTEPMNTETSDSEGDSFKLTDEEQEERKNMWREVLRKTLVLTIATMLTQSVAVAGEEETKKILKRNPHQRSSQEYENMWNELMKAYFLTKQHKQSDVQREIRTAVYNGTGGFNMVITRNQEKIKHWLEEDNKQKEWKAAQRKAKAEQAASAGNILLVRHSGWDVPLQPHKFREQIPVIINKMIKVKELRRVRGPVAKMYKQKLQNVQLEEGMTVQAFFDEMGVSDVGHRGASEQKAYAVVLTFDDIEHRDLLRYFLIQQKDWVVTDGSESPKKKDTTPSRPNHSDLTGGTGGIHTQFNIPTPSPQGRGAGYTTPTQNRYHTPNRNRHESRTDQQ